MDPEPSLFFSYAIDVNLVFGIAGIVVLLFCLGLVSGAEVALFSLSQKDIDTITQVNSSKGKMIAALLEKPKKLVATLLIASNFLNISIILLFYLVVETIFSDLNTTLFKFGSEVLMATFLIVLFGSVLPKVYASRNSLKFSKLTVYPIVFLDKLLSPISLPMRAATIYLHNKLGKQKTNFSVDQLSQALELTASDETSTEEQKILEGIVSFGNTDTRQVMSPRIDIFALEIEESFAVICPKIIEKGYSRIPVYRDNIDQIEGVLYVKDLLPHINTNEFDWKSLLREPFFVPENKKLDNL